LGSKKDKNGQKKRRKRRLGTKGKLIHRVEREKKDKKMGGVERAQGFWKRGRRISPTENE